uniref:Uncharacterized protein n=1 Tax=Oryza nivara TaxID=4536 RepID=A0A0E0HR29_ORYNI
MPLLSYPVAEGDDEPGAGGSGLSSGGQYSVHIRHFSRLLLKTAIVDVGAPSSPVADINH